MPPAAFCGPGVPGWWSKCATTTFGCSGVGIRLGRVRSAGFMCALRGFCFFIKLGVGWMEMEGCCKLSLKNENDYFVLGFGITCIKFFAHIFSVLNVYFL